MFDCKFNTDWYPLNVKHQKRWRAFNGKLFVRSSLSVYMVDAAISIAAVKVISSLNVWNVDVKLLVSERKTCTLLLRHSKKIPLTISVWLFINKTGARRKKNQRKKCSVSLSIPILDHFSVFTFRMLDFNIRENCMFFLSFFFSPTTKCLPYFFCQFRSRIFA